MRVPCQLSWRERRRCGTLAAQALMERQVENYVDSLEDGPCGFPGGWSMWTPWRLVYADSRGQSMWFPWKPVYADYLEAGLCELPGGWSMQTPWRLVYADYLEAGPCGPPGGWSPADGAGACLLSLCCEWSCSSPVQHAL